MEKFEEKGDKVSMGDLNLAEMLSAGLFSAVCAMAGALVMIQQMDRISHEEARYGLPAGKINLIGTIVGGLAGLLAAVLCIYYYLFADSVGWIGWIGRSSYLLVLLASAGHLSVLMHLWIRLNAEDRDLQVGKGPQEGTLSLSRRQGLARLDRGGLEELKTQDKELVIELVGVFGDRLLTSQRALNRIPFYGYLGTVCGILLMAKHLTQLDEATETFQVLRDMAGGLVLAFQTTLVALLAYLPLRKGIDILVKRVSDLEQTWLSMRDE